jgi:opacity protein-like surface antigen
MNRTFKLVLVAAVVAAAAAVPAAAQNVAGTWELTAFGGVTFGNQIYQSGNKTIDVDTAGTFGGRLGYNLTPAFEVEFDYGHTSSDLTGTNYANGKNGKIGTLKMDVFELDGLWHWGNRRNSGYFIFGAGLAVMDPSVEGAATSSDSRFTYSLGVGGKFSITPSAAIRVEGRFRGTSLSNTTSQGVWCDYYGYCYTYSSSWYSNGEITAGITFRFGK